MLLDVGDWLIMRAGLHIIAHGLRRQLSARTPKHACRLQLFYGWVYVLSVCVCVCVCVHIDIIYVLSVGAVCVLSVCCLCVVCVSWAARARTE